MVSSYDTDTGTDSKHLTYSGSCSQKEWRRGLDLGLFKSKSLLLFFLKINLVLIRRYLLYNFVLVFAIHQHESAVGRHMSPPS